MFDVKTLEGLKHVNASKDPEKTKARLKNIWLTLDADGRQTVLGYAGVTKYAVSRSYERGNITPRLAAAFSLALEMNPRYLTGESDAPEGYDEDALYEFIGRKGGAKKTTVRTRTKKAAPEPAAYEDDDIAEADQKRKLSKIEDIIRILSKASSLTSEEIACIGGMPEEEILFLVKALLYKSNYSTDASELMFFIKFLLTV